MKNARLSCQVMRTAARAASLWDLDPDLDLRIPPRWADLYLDPSATGRIRLDLKNPDPSRGPEDRVLRLNRAVFVLCRILDFRARNDQTRRCMR